MNTELALTHPDPSMDEASLRVMMAAAQRYVSSGLLPAEVNTPQKALVVMTAGREMGVPATYALRNIHVVKGKPVCSAELLLALVRRTYGPSAMRVSKTSNTACTVQYREQGWDGISEYTFTIEDAQRAGVANGNQWKSYPAAMLRARCVSAVARFAFPEAIAGLYTPEEMGATVSIDEAGDMQIVEGKILPSIDAPELCDAEHWNKNWHATVKGTRFADDDTRHKYIAYFSENRFQSLTKFLEQATDDDAGALISSIEKRIATEAKKASEPRPITLQTKLEAAVVQARMLGADVDLPENVEQMSDADVQAMLDAVSEAIDMASAVPA